MATHSSIPPWEIQWTEEPGGLHPGVAESGTTETLAQSLIQTWSSLYDLFFFSPDFSSSIIVTVIEYLLCAGLVSSSCLY